MMIVSDSHSRRHRRFFPCTLLSTLGVVSVVVGLAVVGVLVGAVGDGVTVSVPGICCKRVF